MKHYLTLFLTIITTLIIFLIGGLVFTHSAAAHGTYVATKDFIQAEILAPHNSVMTSEQVMAIEQWYGVPAHMTLAIWSAESSLGDPRLDDDLVKVWNVGHISAFPAWQWTKWGALATGTVDIVGKTWLAFPGPWSGAMGWGRYMKVGAHGAYRPFSNAADWTYPIYSIYYGKDVPGFVDALADLRAIDDSYIRLAAAHGFIWR